MRDMSLRSPQRKGIARATGFIPASDGVYPNTVQFSMTIDRLNFIVGCGNLRCFGCFLGQ